ncbi:MAG: bifunctional folylpolyglutamate synthase/dihydrofolate synthase [Eubacteriales bacterium]
MSENSALRDAEERLAFFPRFGAKPGLDAVAALLDAVGNPHEKLKFVHVAGTNGKGSTTAMIASALDSAGYRTGMFTSPSVEKITERVCIGPEPVADGIFADACVRVMDAAAGISDRVCTQSDVLTAAAFLIFFEEGCEAVVAEVGLGGRLDATNIIPSPEVSVITSVSLDHTAQLGGSIAEIAAEKCGIIKPRHPAVSFCGQPAEAAEVIAEQAEMNGSELFVPDMDKLEISSVSPEGSVFCYRGVGYETKMPGRHFVLNALTAIETLKVMARNGWNISEKDIVRGVSVRPLTGRLQTIGADPRILIDGAHNTDAAQRLCETVRELFPDRRIVTVMGMFSDKDFKSCISKVADISDVFIAAQPAGERALDAAEAAEIACGRAGFTGICRSPVKALGTAVRFAGSDDVILCCGSFALLASVKAAAEKYGGRIPEFPK